MKKIFKVLLIVFGSIVLFISVILFFAFIVTPIKTQPKDIEVIAWMNNIEDDKKI